MIPKRIFYVWGATEPKKRDVLACMQTWRQVCPDYEIIEINEESTKYFNFQKELKENRWFKAVYERKMWAYVADYIRIKVLYENGGIYLDTDVSVLKIFDKFLGAPAFVGMQDNSVDGETDFVEPAILGAEKGNRFLKFILDIYESKIWKIPIYTMPELFKYTIDNLYKDNVVSFNKKSEQKIIYYPDIQIYPEKFFIPFRLREKFSPNCIKADTYTIHWWGGSWVRPDILSFLNNKHKFSPNNLKIKKIIEVRLLNIPILNLNEYKNKIRFWKIPLFTIKKDVVNKGKYQQVFELKLLGIISVLRILKFKTLKTKYTLFYIISFKNFYK